MVTLVMHPVKSSNVREIGYDAQRWELYVRYKSAPYVYFNVQPHIFNQLRDAALKLQSVGTYLNEVVKPAYKFQKLHRLISALVVEVNDSVRVEEAGRVQWHLTGETAADGEDGHDSSR